MLQVTVVVKACSRNGAFAIDGVFPTLTDIKTAISQATGIDPRRQLLLHGGRLMFGETDYLTRFDLRAQPEIFLHGRLPDDQLLTVRVRYARRTAVDCSLRADVPVLELKNYLARRYCIAPWKQVLMAVDLKAPMLAPETVGAYAISPLVAVSLAEYNDGQQPELLHITVLDEDTEQKQPFVVERRDTLDVLLGHLERKGMVKKGEKASLCNQQQELLDSRRSFEDYSFHDDDVLMLITGQK